MEIKINGKTYRLKYTLRAMIIFEKITKKRFALDTLTDQLAYLYALLMANNPDMTLTMSGLIDACDNDQSILQDYLDFLRGEEQKSEALDPIEEQNDEDKKKE